MMRKRIEICEELNKKTSIHELKTYRNTRDLLFKTFVTNNIRDTTTINWYTTTSNTIRTIIVIHVRFFVIIVVHHVARVAREFISFRNDQNLNAFFYRDAWNSSDDDEKWIDANKTHRSRKTRKNKKNWAKTHWHKFEFFSERDFDHERRDRFKAISFAHDRTFLTERRCRSCSNRRRFRLFRKSQSRQ